MLMLHRLLNLHGRRDENAWIMIASFARDDLVTSMQRGVGHCHNVHRRTGVLGQHSYRHGPSMGFLIKTFKMTTAPGCRRSRNRMRRWSVPSGSSCQSTASASHDVRACRLLHGQSREGYHLTATLQLSRGRRGKLGYVQEVAAWDWLSTLSIVGKIPETALIECGAPLKPRSVPHTENEGGHVRNHAPFVCFCR